MTVFDAIIESINHASEYNGDDQVAPAVILWPDKDRQWEPLLSALRERLPHLLTLGGYDAGIRTGPAVWLRCMVGRSPTSQSLLPEATWSEKVIPIIYLPGVSRQELRAVADCPAPLMPLAELQYRGVFWSQANSKDWTVLAFLQSPDGGLGLDVARDNATLEAMRTALVKLAQTEVRDLSGHRLEALDFHALLSPDPMREILAWINDARVTQEKMSVEQWQAFCQSCREKFAFHPETDGSLRAAELLGQRQGAWQQIWDRFREAPRRYPNLPGWLKKARPQDQRELFLKESDEVWPQNNEIHETALRAALKACVGKPASVAIQKVKDLEQIHGKRRGWVWADLDMAPLAMSLKHLAVLAATCAKPVAGGGLDDLVAAYVGDSWAADAAALEALRQVDKPEDVDAVQAVVRAFYLPWLEAEALAFQNLVKDKCQAIRSKAPVSLSDTSRGTVVLFADGLRFDMAQLLKQKLTERGLSTELGWRWTALPTVIGE